MQLLSHGNQFHKASQQPSFIVAKARKLHDFHNLNFCEISPITQLISEIVDEEVVFMYVNDVSFVIFSCTDYLCLLHFVNVFVLEH